jgi:hypothetical protein
MVITMTYTQKPLELKERLENPYRPYSQNWYILEALQQGKVTNTDLVTGRVGRKIYKYSSRIAELRSAGFPVIAHHLHDGLWEYQL